MTDCEHCRDLKPVDCPGCSEKADEQKPDTDEKPVYKFGCYEG